MFNKNKTKKILNKIWFTITRFSCISHMLDYVSIRIQNNFFLNLTFCLLSEVVFRYMYSAFSSLYVYGMHYLGFIQVTPFPPLSRRFVCDNLVIIPQNHVYLSEPVIANRLDDLIVSNHQLNIIHQSAYNFGEPLLIEVALTTNPVSVRGYD